MQCFLLTAYPYPSGSYTWKICGNTSVLKPRTSSSGIQGVYWEVDGVDLFGGSFILSGSVAVVPWDTASDYGSCDSCKTSPSIKYDCLNGNCVASTQYQTPGLYQSLSDCQAVCANGGACASGKQCIDPTNFCPPGKICIDQGEFSSIEALISKINSEVC